MVSVLIPVYNKAPFLRDCLDSVYGQTFQDFEIVAVDDASTDNSLALLKAEHDPRLRIIALPRNLGPAGAANAGIEACRGEYIVRLDADDLAVPERLAQQVAYMDAHPKWAPAEDGCSCSVRAIARGSSRSPTTTAKRNCSSVYPCRKERPSCGDPFSKPTACGTIRDGPGSGRTGCSGPAWRKWRASAISMDLLPSIGGVDRTSATDATSWRTTPYCCAIFLRGSEFRTRRPISTFT
ncbi:MAG: glycosyltransferase family 2 protein [Flavobacteriales bacterium]|nr:glycosyltransferase family 2 protein [Flavobacteriales bacterium]